MIDNPTWQEIVAASGLITALTSTTAWFAGRKYQHASTDQARTEADKARIEASKLHDAVTGEFEAAVNARVKIIFEEQNQRINQLTEEVKLLRTQVFTLTSGICPFLRDGNCLHPAHPTALQPTPP